MQEVPAGAQVHLGAWIDDVPPAEAGPPKYRDDIPRFGDNVYVPPPAGSPREAGPPLRYGKFGDGVSASLDCAPTSTGMISPKNGDDVGQMPPRLIARRI